MEQLLKEKGFSKAEFATRMGLRRQNLDVMLNSQKKDINVIIRMAEILDVPFDEFCGFLPEKRHQPEGIIKYDGHYYDVHTTKDIEDLLKLINNS